MGTSKSERKYGAKTEKVVATRQRKKRIQVQEATIRIMVDHANFLKEKFKTHKEAREHIDKLQARNKEQLIVCDYQIV